MKSILEYIPKGRKNAVSARTLMRKTGLSERQVQAAVLQARANGVPICSSINGYFIPESAEEAAGYCREQYKRIKSGFIALKPVKDYVRSEASREVWEQLEAEAHDIE